MAHFETYRALRDSQCCPACKENVAKVGYRYRHDGGDSFVYRCDSCTLEFLRPLALTEVEERRMESVGDAELFHSDLLRTLHERLIIGPEIAKVRSLLGKSDFSMLDIGCGTGWVSRIWADAGARVTGLEPSQARAAIARERGLRVLSCYVEELDTAECFDLIVMRHVVEHLESPDGILQGLRERLNPGGVLLIIVPNIDCVGRKVFGTNWSWVLPWHCSFFNPVSLKRLLTGCGYDIAATYQTPSPLWYPESFTRRFPRLGRLLNRIPFSMFLFAPLVGVGYLGGFSDNLTIMARRKE